MKLKGITIVVVAVGCFSILILFNRETFSESTSENSEVKTPEKVKSTKEKEALEEIEKKLQTANPEEVVSIFVEAISKGSLEAIRMVHDPEIWDELSVIWEGSMDSIDVSSWKVFKEIQKEDKALVIVLVGWDGESKEGVEDAEIFFFKKTDKGWKIDYDDCQELMEELKRIAEDENW